jgi:hypothetical protein
MSFYWDSQANRYYSTIPEAVVTETKTETSKKDEISLLQDLFDQLRRSPLRCEKPDVQVKNIGSNTVTLEWPIIFNAKTYSVMQKTADSKWHLSIPSQVTQGLVEVTNLDPCRTYQFKITPIPYNKSNESLTSDPVEVTTKSNGTIPYLDITRIADVWVELEIVPMKNTTTNKVMYRYGQNEWFTKTFSSSLRILRLSQLKQDTEYEVKVQPVGDDTFPDSKVIKFKTDKTFTETTSINGEATKESIELTIGEVNEATSYILEMNRGLGWTDLYECLSTNYTVMDVVPGQTYSFRATPMKGQTRGKTSGQFQITIPCECTVVSELKASSDGEKITLSWDHASEEKYTVQLLDKKNWTTIQENVQSPFVFRPKISGSHSLRVCTNCITCLPSNITISRTN